MQKIGGRNFNNVGGGNSLIKADKPSRFVVDLKKQIESAEETEKKKNNRAGVYEKISEFDFKEYIKSKKEKARDNKEILKKYLKQPVKLEKENIKKAVAKIVKKSASIDYASRPFRPSVWHSVLLFFHLSDKARDAYLMYYEKINGLFFVQAFKFIGRIFIKTGRLFYRFFYFIGWTFVFIIRFAYFSVLEIINPVRSLCKALNSVFANLFLSIHTTKNKASNEVHSHSKTAGHFTSNGVKLIIGAFKIVINGLKPLKKDAIKIKQVVFSKSGNATPPMPPLIKGGNSHFTPSIVKKGNYYLSPTIKEKNSLKPTLIFAIVIFALILPFKLFTYYQSLDLKDLRAKVLGASFDAINSLKLAGEDAGNLNFDQANKNFSQAASRFLDAQNELKSINDFLFTLSSLVPNKGLRLASQSKNILSAGEIASSLGGNLSQAVNCLIGEGGEENKGLKNANNNFIVYGLKALEETGRLKLVLNDIDADSLPDDYGKQFISIKNEISFLENGLVGLIKLAKEAQIFTGSSEENQYKRYLLVFQNNAEMRATGGFIGSFALIDFQNGEIKNIEVPGGGSYDTEGGLYDLIAAPEPLRLVNPLWHFWDANWWPDWEKSAKKLAWFYEHSGGPTVDGVIGLTPQVIEKMLEAIGPVDMTAKYGVVITHENFYEIVQKLSERKDTNKSKDIIGDLAKKIMEDLPAKLDKNNLLNLAEALEESLNEKHILFYFTDSELEKNIAKYGWDGKIKKTQWDYLSVVNTNIAGGKTDRKIRETINHKAEVMPDGSVTDTVEIKREHTGVKFESFSGIRNVDWMRIYVPLGSKLLEAEGFEKPDKIYFGELEAYWQKDDDVSREENFTILDEGSGTKIYEEEGKTVFANWSMVDPGQTIVIRLKYRLPFNLSVSPAYKLSDKIIEAVSSAEGDSAPYALLVQKQSGSVGSIVKSELSLPANMKVVWHYPAKAPIKESGWQIDDILNTDKYWAAVINIKN